MKMKNVMMVTILQETDVMNHAKTRVLLQLAMAAAEVAV
jgi:hypothetical protein